MADRSVSVRLNAVVEPYVAAMRRARGATDDVAQSGGRSMQQLGAQLQTVGRAATIGVTLPLVGAGAAAVNLAGDFDASMTKIVSLVGIGADEVDGMRESVLGLSGETARSPQELADALFVITSAGLRGEDAMGALEYAAKASAAGLGETRDVAQAVASTMNAYGPDVLDAAAATDILTATARAGNFETSQLAGALGRVLPFASQAGVAFEEVGGAVALLTRTNGDAGQSITQLTGLMRGFVTPTAEAQTVLGEIGLTIDDVRASIDDQGLVGTLQMLEERLGGSTDKFSLLFGGAEAAAAAIGILDADAATLDETFGGVAESVDITNEAFAATADSDAFKMKQAMEELRTAMVQIGEVLLPVVADITQSIAGLAGWFSDLDPTVQKVIVALAGVTAAAGPVIYSVGKVTSAIGNVSKAFGKLNGLSSTAALKFGAVGVALAGAAIIYGNYAKKKAEAAAKTREFVDAMKEEADGNRETLVALVSRELSTERMVELLDKLGVSAGDVARTLNGESSPAFDAFLEIVGDMNGSVVSLKDAIDGGTLAFDGSAAEAAELYFAYQDLVGIMGNAREDAEREVEVQTEVAEVYGDVTEAVEEQAGAIPLNTEALGEYLRVSKDTVEATGGLSEGLEGLTGLVKDMTDVVPPLGEAMDGVRQSWDDAAQAAQDWADDIDESVDSGAESFAEFSEDAMTSVDTFIAELQAQAEAVAGWGQNIQEIGAETSPEFAAYLAEMGVAGATLVSDLAGNEADLQTAFDAWLAREAEMNTEWTAGMDEMSQAAVDGVEDIDTESRSPWDGVRVAFGDLAAAAREASVDEVKKMPGETVDVVDSIAGKLGPSFDSLETTMRTGGKESGGAFGAGAEEGIDSWVGNVVAAAENLVRQTVAAAKRTGGIRSPSKVFHDEVGVPIIQGIVEGINSEAITMSNALAHTINVAEGVAVGEAQKLVVRIAAILQELVAHVSATLAGLSRAMNVLAAAPIGGVDPLNGINGVPVSVAASSSVGSHANDSINANAMQSANGGPSLVATVDAAALENVVRKLEPGITNAITAGVRQAVRVG